MYCTGIIAVASRDKALYKLPKGSVTTATAIMLKTTDFYCIPGLGGSQVIRASDKTPNQNIKMRIDLVRSTLVALRSTC